MNAEDQNSLPIKEQLKRARRAAVVLAVSTIVSILFFIYAFVQKAEAERLLQATEEAQQQLLQQRSIAEQARQEAEMQRAMAAEALVALKECKKEKK